KTDFYRSEYQKRKDKICPFSSLAFFQPTTVDKEPDFFCLTFGVQFSHWTDVFLYAYFDLM
ncbi:hypothetical protein, partial [Streptococcus pneumoniae]|uniref:hypothetical protein n=1 Tax=Streptococcus pneumoniae TaxID=1313 RepID=UPI001C71EA9E